MPKLIKHNKNKKTNKNKSSAKKHSHSINSKKTQQRRKLYVKKSKIVKQKKRLSKLKLVGGSDDVLPKDIKHFWYKSWPDKGVPEEKNLVEFKEFINNLIEDINKDINQNKSGGTVIHCSAGVGRTGTVYVILKLLLGKGITDINTIEKGNITYDEVIDAIKEARKHRMMLVQTESQLEFICELFFCQDGMMKNYEEYKDKVKSTYNSDYLKKVDKKTINSILSVQLYFTNIYNDKITDDDKKTNVALLPDNKGKNRFVNILPYDKTRVILDSSNNNDNYINANFLNSILKKPYTHEINSNDPFQGIVIATQCPKSNTKQDFLRM